MIYLDNAATTYPKPEAVYLACDASLRRFANAGRGAHKQTLDAARAIYETRLACAQFFGIKQAERLIFTPGCTQAINMALRGFGLLPGDCVVTSAIEHNAVMRTLFDLEKSIGIKIHVLPYAKKGIVDKDDLSKAVKQLKPRLCVFNEASNITGEVVDLKSISRICRDNSVPLMVDAAQSAGLRAIDIDAMGISLWCAAGHKGLMAAPGIGLLYVAPDISLEPLIAGGTGSHSEELLMPTRYPDHLEAGTQNAPAIAGLGAAIGFLLDTGLESIAKRQAALTEHFLRWAASQPDMQVYSADISEESVGIISFRLQDIGCDKVADILDSQFDISVRAGLHCAALAHKTLGTTDGGLVRVSFGFFNTLDDVDRLCRAISSILTKAKN